MENIYDIIVTKKTQDNDCVWKMDVTELKKKTIDKQALKKRH